jgi:hypothetical protein
MNVNDMRTFETEPEAHEYIRTIVGPYGGSRVYELFSDKPPRLCKPPKTP